MNACVDLGDEVADPLRERRPVVALESTIIAHGMPWPQNVETALAVEAEVRALGAVPATVGVIDKAALRRLFADHPRLGLLLYTLAQAERVALADRLASVGRTSARARVAALICDIMRRLRAAGEAMENGIPLPLTQEEIGDATGLTAVHVNRMMRQLVEEGVISRTNGRVNILDEARLAGTANHIDRFATIDTSWLGA